MGLFDKNKIYKAWTRIDMDGSGLVFSHDEQ